jgi:hypothetical protein
MVDDDLVGRLPLKHWVTTRAKDVWDQRRTAIVTPLHFEPVEIRHQFENPFVEKISGIGAPLLDIEHELEHVEVIGALGESFGLLKQLGRRHAVLAGRLR